jgi:hypothetical protein
MLIRGVGLGMQDQSPSGFDAIPVLNWGSHLGQFYEDADDLRDILVPYFQAGLQNNESCLWVTSAPFCADQAREALRAVIPDFDVREARRQIEIRDAHEWYGADDKVEPEELIADLLRREQDALDQGYEGLRTNGNCAWLHERQWADFQAYEARVHETVRGRRMICMCSYRPAAIDAHDALEVMGRHDFILPRPARGRVPISTDVKRRVDAPSEEREALLETPSGGYLHHRRRWLPHLLQPGRGAPLGVSADDRRAALVRQLEDIPLRRDRGSARSMPDGGGGQDRPTGAWR